METWRLIQNNAMETRKADVHAMIEVLKIIALCASTRADQEINWQHLGGAVGWYAMTTEEQQIFTVLLGRIEASA